MGSVVFSSYYSLPVTGYATYNVRIGFSEDYSITTNKTKLKITSVELQKEGNTTNWGSLPFFGAVKVNGATLLTMNGGSSMRVSLSGSGYCSVAIPASSEVEILHEDDGSKTVTFEIVGGISYAGYNHFAANYVDVQNNKGYPMGARSQSQTVALTTHPRGSSITYCPSTAETQQEIQLTVTRYSSAFYNKATFKIGSTVLYESSAFETSLSYTIPRTWFNSYPNDASLNVTVSVQTYTDQTCTETIGSPATTTMTVNADAGMKPSLSSGWATLAPYNTGAVSGLTGYVKGYSKAEATFDSTKITNAAGASIASYSVTCQGETVISSPYLTPVLASTSVVCTVTDTRGRSASETFTLPVMDYSPPILTEQTVFRCNSQGNPDEDGTYFSVKATLTYASLDGQNTCSLTAAVAPAGGSYGAETALTSGTASMIGPVSADQTYSVRISALDALGNNAVYYVTVPTRKWAMKFRANGSGVAFGKAAESDGVFEIADGWAVKSRGIVDLIYPVGSIYLSVSGTSPATLFGGTWTRIKDRFLLAAGDVYSAGATGGEAAHTLTTDEMPSHRHYVGAVGWPVDAAGPEHINSNWGSSAWPKVTPIDSTDDAGGGAAHNNMPPYLAVYIWQRTA